MKLGLYLLLLLPLASASHNDLSEVRNLYMAAAAQEASCVKLVNSLNNINAREQATLAGYKACGTMMMANYQINPISKLNSFNEGKKLLDQCVSWDVNNTELRFLRFSAQCESPAFLGYTDNIEMDKSLILRTFPYLNDIELQQMIRNYMVESDRLTMAEKRVFTKPLN